MIKPRQVRDVGKRIVCIEQMLLNLLEVDKMIFPLNMISE